MQGKKLIGKNELKAAEKFLANFHNKAERILVTTETMRKELIEILCEFSEMNGVQEALKTASITDEATDEKTVHNS